MNIKWLSVILLIVVVGIGGWYVFAQLHKPAPTPVQDQTTSGGYDVPPRPLTVTYTDDGFGPDSATIAPGQTVTWINLSSGTMWVASDDVNEKTECAPGYTGPAPFDACKALPMGSTYAFTFTTAGTWQYHNKGTVSHTGTIMVKAAK